MIESLLPHNIALFSVEKLCLSGTSHLQVFTEMREKKEKRKNVSGTSLHDIQNIFQLGVEPPPVSMTAVFGREPLEMST